jgi:hypothetical protein
MSKTKSTAKPTIMQATSFIIDQPPLTERERARSCEILEFVVVKFFSNESVKHLQAEARAAAGRPFHMWRQGGDVLEKIMAPLQETLVSKGVLPPEIPLRDITIIRTDTGPKQTLTGAQLERILLVMQWADFPFDDPDHGSDFWPLAAAGELGCLLRGLGQLIDQDLHGGGEPDCTDTFLASSQKLLSAAVMCVERDDDSKGPEIYAVHVGKQPAAAVGGAR